MAKINQAMLHNKAYIIGGAIVAQQHKWIEFFKILTKAQIQLLKQNLVDDDQGLYLMCHHLYPKLIQLHYLGKNNWFGTFQQFHL